jgi:hypothetical protein
MVIEVLAAENGTILALGAPDDTRISKHLRLAASRGAQTAPQAPPTITMRPRPGQQRHLVTLPDELANMSLKEIHRSYRLVHHAAGPRLEPIAP